MIKTGKMEASNRRARCQERCYKMLERSEVMFSGVESKGWGWGWPGMTWGVAMSSHPAFIAHFLQNFFSLLVCLSGVSLGQGWAACRDMQGWHEPLETESLGHGLLMPEIGGWPDCSTSQQQEGHSQSSPGANLSCLPFSSHTLTC